MSETVPLPSLAALRAFSAAASEGGFSAAARELNVTHAAVAQHVRTLEAHFGVPLMVRAGRGMALTPEGEILAAGLSDGFGTIAAACRDLAAQGRDRPLRISTTPAFAGTWLMPRLVRFWTDHPEVRLEVVPDHRLADLRRDGFDAAIRYGRGPWPGVESERLIAADHVVVAPTAWAAKLSGATLPDLVTHPWVLEVGRNEERLWAASRGLDLDRADVRELPSITLVLETVRSGYGLTIAPAPLVARERELGTILALHHDCGGDTAYHLLTRPGDTGPALKTFRRWLRREAR
ncbi:LysR family transcriptional regulator [Rhodobacteraceae bacterium CCMM004]|nr:LysR family transcriptional regulator [Rhodobacteraceae bacterium CCMM004]